MEMRAHQVKKYFQIAIELMPDIDDLSLNVNGWEEGYIESCKLS